MNNFENKIASQEYLNENFPRNTIDGKLNVWNIKRRYNDDFVSWEVELPGNDYICFTSAKVLDNVLYIVWKDRSYLPTNLEFQEIDDFTVKVTPPAYFGKVSHFLQKNNYYKMIKSTMGFAVTTTSGIIEKTSLSVAPTVENGAIQNAPAKESGVLWLVNGLVFSTSDRQDFIMFDPAETLRDGDSKAIAQGGYIMRDGSTYKF